MVAVGVLVLLPASDVILPRACSTLWRRERDSLDREREGVTYLVPAKMGLCLPSGGGVKPAVSWGGRGTVGALSVQIVPPRAGILLQQTHIQSATYPELLHTAIKQVFGTLVMSVGTRLWVWLTDLPARPLAERAAVDPLCGHGRILPNSAEPTVLAVMPVCLGESISESISSMCIEGVLASPLRSAVNGWRLYLPGLRCWFWIWGRNTVHIETLS